MFVRPWRAGKARDLALRLSRRTGFAWFDANANGHPRQESWLASDPIAEVVASGESANPLSALNELDIASDPNAHFPRWFGVVAYDAYWNRANAKHQQRKRDYANEVLRFHRYDAVAHANESGEVTAVYGDDEAACARFMARAESAATIAEPTFIVGEPSVPAASEHEAAIQKALDHIRRGDIYQVNLARRWRAKFEGEPLALFLAMRDASPVPLGFYFSTPHGAIASRSMETFLQWAGPETRTLISRPIKGTIARSGARDSADASELVADPKEHSEHAMIVDLVRNDLGRVAETGSVKLRDVMTVEPYAKLSHLVTTVEARTRENISLAEIFEATFPPGSVTGAPKIRAMQIIEDAEPVARGVYTGAVGYVSASGACRFAVAIRTAEIRDGYVDYFAGGGIVNASNPAKEVAETELKARVFLDAIGKQR